MVREVWDVASLNVTQIMSHFQCRAQEWNRHVFGNIFDCKYKCLARLEGIQRKLAHGPSAYLARLEQSLRLELNETLLQEESLWR